MKSELEKFYSLIDDIEVAMMTTRRPDGHLCSRDGKSEASGRGRLVVRDG